MPHREPPICEALEPRVLLSVNFTIDYTYDANGFFDDPARRDVIEAAADYLGSLLDDSLAAIVPGGGNDWSIRFTDPATGMPAEVDGPTIDQDELLLFVGGRDLSGDTLGLGGAGGWQASGSNTFLLTVEGRGQSGATGPDAGQSDTSLWGGSIAFDADSNWHFGTTTSGLAGNEHDFYSVALHEMMHVLGFSDGTPAFANLISSSGEFMGAAAMALSADTQLDTSDLAHWREGLTSAGQETAMDPTFTRGTRKLLTPLDFAALEDIGWELGTLRWPGLGASIALSSTTGDGVASGSASPAAPGLHWVTPNEGGLLDFRVTADQPVTLRLWDSQGLVVSEMTTADTITGLGIAATDQFYSIEVISSSAATYDMAVSSGGLDEISFYPEGYSSTEIDQFVSVSNPTDSAQLFSLMLRYERDSLGRDVDTVAFEQVIEPGQRVTVDIIRDGVFAQDIPNSRTILDGQPYALVLASTAPLGAALEHADVFNGQRITTAEDFTQLSNATWHFPRVEKAADVSDFLVFFNPNDHDIEVSVKFVTTTGQFRLVQTIRAEARGGLSVQGIAALPLGAFGVIVTSEAADPADQMDHEGIAAGLSHYDGVNGVGWTVLGTPGTLPASNIAPLAELPGSTTEVLVFNPGTSTARLSLVRTTSMGDETLSDRFVPAGSSNALTVPNALGYRYEFTLGTGVVQFVQSTSTEATSGRTPTVASRNHAFSLGEFDPASSDSVLRLGIYNTSMTGASVTVRFVFLSGLEVVQSISVDGQGFRSLQIDTISAVRDRAGGPLAVFLESSTPITGVLAALDGELAWASGGMLLGA